MKLIALLLALACAGAAAAVSLARPSATSLVGTVGPGFSITLTKDGQRVTHLDPGDYTITVHDLATEHDFHLAGGGVSKATSIEGTGDETWDVTLTTDTYTFFCDAHVATMLGTFAVGDVPVTTTTTTTTRAPPPPALRVRASATVAGRVVTIKATATRPSSLDVSLLKGTKRVAHRLVHGQTATVKLKAPAAGRYVAKVIAKAGAATATAGRRVTVR